MRITDIVGDDTALADAYRRYEKKCQKTREFAVQYFSEFVMGKAHLAFLYGIGEVVKDGDTYGIVTDYSQGMYIRDPYCWIVVSTKSGIRSWYVQNDNPMKYKTKIPSELMELAKAQLINMCPLCRKED